MWYTSPKSQQWINSNPSVNKWLTRLGSDESRSTYGQCLQAFCEWSRKTPEQLLEMATQDSEASANGDKYRTLNRVQEFILKGEYQDKRRGHEGRICKVGELGRKRRELFYISIRSFFTHNRTALPDDPAFKIRDLNRAPKTTYMPLDKARAIIGALKDPYRTVFTAALYGGMGRSEILLLNKLWPNIRKQLKEGKDPIRIDYGGRKGNPKPFFTLVPAKILMPYQDLEANPFQGIARIKGYPKDSPKVLRPIKGVDLNVAWRFARKRAGITEPYTSHMLRDLFKTGLGYHLGLRQETTDFLTGHVARVDPNAYLQIMNEPDTAIKEWEKIRTYLDSGTDTETKENIAKLEKQADTRDKEIKDLRIEIKRMQIREIEKRFNMGTTPLDIEIPDPSENPPITDEQAETRKQEIEEYEDYKAGELAGLARLKKELAKLESG